MGTAHGMSVAYSVCRTLSEAWARCEGVSGASGEGAVQGLLGMMPGSRFVSTRPGLCIVIAGHCPEKEVLI